MLSISDRVKGLKGGSDEILGSAADDFGVRVQPLGHLAGHADETCRFAWDRCGACLRHLGRRKTASFINMSRKMSQRLNSNTKIICGGAQDFITPPLQSFDPVGDAEH
ncbi:MAG: hypothetical protein AAF913_02740, partial [Pseudomonadota bacterium]